MIVYIDLTIIQVYYMTWSWMAKRYVENVNFIWKSLPRLVITCMKKIMICITKRITDRIGWIYRFDSKGQSSIQFNQIHHQAELDDDKCPPMRCQNCLQLVLTPSRSPCPHHSWGVARFPALHTLILFLGFTVRRPIYCHLRQKLHFRMDLKKGVELTNPLFQHSDNLLFQIDY
jgi:hypothetical protein